MAEVFLRNFITFKNSVVFKISRNMHKNYEKHFLSIKTCGTSVLWTQHAEGLKAWALEAHWDLATSPKHELLIHKLVGGINAIICINCSLRTCYQVICSASSHTLTLSFALSAMAVYGHHWHLLLKHTFFHNLL